MKSKIPQEWSQTKIGKIGKVVGGGTPSTKVNEYYEDGDIPWITPKDLSGYRGKYISQGERNITKLGLEKSSAKLYPKGTVLFSSRAPIGYVAIAANELSTNQGFKSVIPDDDITITNFVYYLLKYNTEKIKNVGSGSTFREVSGKVLKNFEILLPPLHEQVKIANILSSIDDKIENNNAIIANLEEQAQAIFKSCFVDFEPFQDNEFIENEIGDIPVGWKVSTLEELSKIIDNRGKTPPLSDTTTDYPIIDVATLKSPSRLVEYDKAKKFVDAETYNTWFRSGHPKYGDILLSTVGSVGHSKIFLNDFGTIAQNVVAFRFEQELTLYMYQWFKQNHSKLVSFNIGSVQPSIKVTQINKIKIVIPSQKVLDKYNSLMKPINDFVNNKYNENKRLTDIRDTLLPKLMSGEIQVGETAEIID